MTQFHFYDQNTGLLHGNSIVLNAPEDNDATLMRNCPIGHKPVQGNLHPLTQRVDIATGQVIDYQPPAPSVDHEWNADTKRWQLSAAVVATAEARTVALAAIVSLETQGIRSMRELALGLPGAQERVTAIDAQIAKLRLSL